MKTFLIVKLGVILKGIGLNAGFYSSLLIALITIPIVLYSLFLLTSVIALALLKNEKNSSNRNPSVSVIVAIRNGEKSISKLIDCFLKQNY